MDFSQFDRRPIVVAVAGPNGAGKTTFYHSHLLPAGLPFINADVLARELNLDPYAAAGVADALRREFVKRRQSFVFETVFSDPVGAKRSFLKEAARAGYNVILCFVGVSGHEVCQQRVAMRVSRGGHDVPNEKLRDRFPRIIANLEAAIDEVPYVLIYDNDDLSRPFRQVTIFESGSLTSFSEPAPDWLKPLLK